MSTHSDDFSQVITLLKRGDSPGLRSPLMHILSKIIASSPGGLKYGSQLVSNSHPNWKHMVSCKHKAGNVLFGPVFEPYSIYYRGDAYLSLNNEVEQLEMLFFCFVFYNNTKQTGFIHELGPCKNIQ